MTLNDVIYRSILCHQSITKRGASTTTFNFGDRVSTKAVQLHFGISLDKSPEMKELIKAREFSFAW